MTTTTTTTQTEPNIHHHLLLIIIFSTLLLLSNSQPLSSPSPSPLPPPSPPLSPFNYRLEAAYVAFQAWKHLITSDPKNFTANWCGPFVCNYTGVFCAPAPDDSCILTVAGVDLNHARITGELPEHLGLLTDLTLLHLNTNRFHGTIPETLTKLHLLYELDLSNNRFAGNLPVFLLSLKSLKYLDVRYNKFEGQLPDQVFAVGLDAIFLNNNNFNATLSSGTFTSSTASVLVLANMRLDGCLPSGIGKMSSTLNQLILLNSGISACIPEEIGELKNLTVLDLSHNNFVGPLPASIGEMEQLQQLDVGHNMLSGEIPESICELPNLKNFTFDDNYFWFEPEPCCRIKQRNDTCNCIPELPDQRPFDQCIEFFHRPPANCHINRCVSPMSPAPAPAPVYY